jgi:chromosome segregation ATPase
VTLLQNKLESETQSKLALIRVKTEIEKHLSLERERADLLQHELESQKDAIHLFNKEEQNWQNELEQAKLMNMQLREQLKNANEAGILLNEKVDVIQPRLDQSMNALSKMSDKYSKLEKELSEAQSDNVQLVRSLNEIKGENAELEKLLERVNEERDQLADALASAQQGIGNLLGTVDKVREYYTDVVSLLYCCNAMCTDEEVCHILI